VAFKSGSLVLSVLVVLAWNATVSGARFTQCLDPVTGQVFQCLDLSPPPVPPPRGRQPKEEGPPIRSCEGYENKLSKLQEDLDFASSGGKKYNHLKLKIDEEYRAFQRVNPFFG
jgi:hypothetical protein